MPSCTVMNMLLFCGDTIRSQWIPTGGAGRGKDIWQNTFRIWQYASQRKYYRTYIWPRKYCKLWQVNVYGDLDDKSRNYSHFITCCRFTTTTIFIIILYFPCSSTWILQVASFQWRFKWQMIWYHKPFPWHNTIEECWARRRYEGQGKLLHLTWSVGCNYLSLPLIPASGTKLLNWTTVLCCQSGYFVRRSTRWTEPKST